MRRRCHGQLGGLAELLEVSAHVSHTGNDGREGRAHTATGLVEPRNYTPNVLRRGRRVPVVRHGLPSHPALRRSDRGTGRNGGAGRSFTAWDRPGRRAMVCPAARRLSAARRRRHGAPARCASRRGGRAVRHRPGHAAVRRRARPGRHPAPPRRRRALHGFGAGASGDVCVRAARWREHGVQHLSQTGLARIARCCQARRRLGACGIEQELRGLRARRLGRAQRASNRGALRGEVFGRALVLVGRGVSRSSTLAGSTAPRPTGCAPGAAGRRLKVLGGDRRESPPGVSPASP